MPWTSCIRRSSSRKQYIEYTPQKKKRYKHGGRVYVLSPYDMVWNSDAYYVCGYSESHARWSPSG